MTLHEGSLLQNGRYKIVKVIGQGGFGITYLAEQTLLQKQLCVKEFFPKEQCDRQPGKDEVTLGNANSVELINKYKAKFIKEAQMIARLSHPGIVGIYDVFEENNTAYYVTEFIDGKNLNLIVKQRGAFKEQEAISIIKSVGETLSFIHSKGIMHLDIKPSNILLRHNGKPVLIDFGMAKQYDEAGDQTSSTPVGISVCYTPLEQYNASSMSEFSPRTDVYSLAATLFRLVTGQVPPSASDVMNTGLPIMEGVSQTVQSAIEKGMQPRIKDRPASVKEFIDMLGDITDSPVVMDAHFNVQSDFVGVDEVDGDTTMLIEDESLTQIVATLETPQESIADGQIGDISSAQSEHDATGEKKAELKQCDKVRRIVACVLMILSVGGLVVFEGCFFYSNAQIALFFTIVFGAPALILSFIGLFGKRVKDIDITIFIACIILAITGSILHQLLIKWGLGGVLFPII